MATKQLDFWKSEFGYEYSLRGQNIINSQNEQLLVRDWGKILQHAINPKPQSVLEVGCNIGRNLIALRPFVSELHAIEPNAQACATAKQNLAGENAKIHVGDGFNLPYDDNSIDLVFTSGVLIHIAPDNLEKVVREIYRVAKHYIVCIEYFSHEPVAINYHGKDGYLFKRDFGGFYLDHCPNLNVIDYGFLWQRLDSSDNSNWWLFSK